MRPSRITIDLAALRHNYQAIAQMVAPARIMPVLKANAYGHGLIPCARELERLGVDCIAVAFLEEAIELREAGVRCHILALGGLSMQQIDEFLDRSIDMTASSVDKLRSIDARAKKRGLRARVQLKIDTGMERIGVHHYSAEPLLACASESQHCDIVGIYSHCANADGLETEFTRVQLERFKEVLQIAEKLNLLSAQTELHMANSGATLCVPESRYTIVRPGLLLFGYTPCVEMNHLIDLKPVLQLSSEVVYFKVIEQGAGVSYGHIWHAPEQTRVVTIPIGYGDGYMRAFSGSASVLIRGKRYPVVGRVCMDQLVVNISWDEAFNGDEVILLGSQGDASINLHELAQWANTDPREVLCALNTRLPRQNVNAEWRAK